MWRWGLQLIILIVLLSWLHRMRESFTLRDSLQIKVHHIKHEPLTNMHTLQIEVTGGKPPYTLHLNGIDNGFFSTNDYQPTLHPARYRIRVWDQDNQRNYQDQWVDLLNL